MVYFYIQKFKEGPFLLYLPSGQDVVGRYDIYLSASNN